MPVAATAGQGHSLSGSCKHHACPSPTPSPILTATPTPTPTATPTPSPTPTPTPSSAPIPNGPGGSWTLGFDDEFSGTSLDTTKWSTGWFGSGITGPVNSEEQQCYDPTQVTMSGGALNLTAIAKSETCVGTTRPYASGMVTSNGKYQYTYGYAESRIWLPGTTQISDWPAWWQDGQSWPTTGEIDIVEGLSGAACWHFIYSGGNPGGCAPGTYAGGWHTFGADWEPTAITYYYDGVQVGWVTSGVTSASMYLLLNLAVDQLYGGPVQIPATMSIDYVRVWQR